MSCCVQFLGRLFLAIIFVGAGVAKFQQTPQQAGYLNSRYPAFHTHVNTLSKQYLQFELPPQLSPAFIKTHSLEIIQGVGAAEVLLGLFVILNQGWAGQLLALLTLSFVAIIHNPILHGANQSEKLGEQVQALLNIGIAGALLLVGQSKGSSCQPCGKAEAAPKKKVDHAAPPKKSKRN